MPTLLHGPGFTLGEYLGVPPSCALLGGFAFSTWVSYDNVAQTAKCQRVLVLDLCLVAVIQQQEALISQSSLKNYKNNLVTNL